MQRGAYTLPKVQIAKIMPPLTVFCIVEMCYKIRKKRSLENSSSMLNFSTFACFCAQYFSFCAGVPCSGFGDNCKFFEIATAHKVNRPVSPACPNSPH